MHTSSRNPSRRPLPRRSALSALLVVALGLMSPAVQAQSANANPKAQAAAAETERWAPGRLLVQPRPGLSDSELDGVLRPHGGRAVGKIDGIGVHIVELPPQASEKAVEALLKHNKHLKFVERDRLVEAAGFANDTYYANAWHLPKVQADAAWDLSTGAGVVIAVLDSGVDGAHPDLAGKLVPGWNLLDNNANTADVNGHGTAVAGAAAAATNNGAGVAAIAGDAMIMPVRIADANAYAYWSTVAKGLTWAADNGADVVNISYNGVSGSSTVQSAARYLQGKGGVTVVAAGNSGGEEAIAPSDALISVSATGSTDARASFSSYGQYVDIAAPGVSIWTTVRGGSYQKWNGTSLASPVVAGVLGLMKSANPALGATELEALLLASTDDLGALGWDPYYGEGRVNALAAVQAAQAVVPADTVAPVVGIVSPRGGETVKGVAAIDVSATDNIDVSRVELLVNGQAVASDTTQPFGFSWDSTQVADGSATLTARAFDAAGNQASSAVTVKVANAEAVAPTQDVQAPVASISSPPADRKVSGTVTVQASATDNVGVTRVRLRIDGALVASVSGAKLSYRWNTKKVATGSHVILVEADDAAGNTGIHSIQVTR